MEKITSLQNPRIKQALKLHTSRGRKSQDRMILFGKRQVNRAVRAKIAIEEVYVSELITPNELQTVLSSVGSNASVCSLSANVFSKLMFGDRDDEVIAVAKRPDSRLDNLNLTNPAIVLVAQAIEKPGNLGAILRSADACSVSAVVLVDALTDFYHPNSIRASTGAVFELQTASSTSEEAKDWLKENGFRVLTARLEGATDFFEQQLRGDIAIVVGNEANGLDHQWADDSFTPVKLPMLGVADSLNVSVSASVMLFEANRQRR